MRWKIIYIGFASALWLFGADAAGSDKYEMVMQPPSGYRIPRIIGASGLEAVDTGFDYFDWFSFSHHRLWFRPGYSSLTDDARITSAKAFQAASEAIRKEPGRQGTASDFYIDWDHFHTDYKEADLQRRMEYLARLNIEVMMVSTVTQRRNISDDWVSKFKHWKYWYALVYYMASHHDVSMYEFGNESHHNNGDYKTWESHWLVAADAIRKAIADVNRDCGKNLTPKICGPVCAGVYWDYNNPDPYEDAHGWGSVSWQKVKYDIYGNYNKTNPWNYGMYDYHRYGQDAARSEEILLKARKDIAHAKNDPNPDIPLLITEYNTSTTGNFNKRNIDTEDLQFGICMAQILEASAAYGPAGLGDEGGLFIFKLGERQKGRPLVGLGNKLVYTSQHSSNGGGITRGGACFQLYAKHFGDGKPIVPFEVKSGANPQRRTIAVDDEKKRLYYIYGSNVSGVETSVSINLSALEVQTGGLVTIHRVDEYNTGQITEAFRLKDSKKVAFDAPNYTAFMVTVPMGRSGSKIQLLYPDDDDYQVVSKKSSHGAKETMQVSMHHADPDKRKVGLIKFNAAPRGSKRTLLKLSGRNSGKDQSKREIVHVYAVSGAAWNEGRPRSWSNTPGVGKYYKDAETMGETTGLGPMVDIEDNYAGYSDGAGKGLGIYGTFVGALSFYSSEFTDNYLDVTEYLKTIDSTEKGVTFIIARIVRYNVNEYENAYYYTLGDYHYDGRTVEIASKEHKKSRLRPSLICID